MTTADTVIWPCSGAIENADFRRLCYNGVRPKSAVIQLVLPGWATGARDGGLVQMHPSHLRPAVIGSASRAGSGCSSGKKAGSPLRVQAVLKDCTLR